MLKDLPKILCAIFFVMAFPLKSTVPEEKIGHSKRQFFIGLGPNFGEAGTWGLAQLGFGTSVFRENNLDVLAGPLLNIAFSRAGAFFDLDLFLKANYDFRAFNEYSMSIYGKLPLGYTLMPGKIVTHGMNFGVIPGVVFNINNCFGVFAELGYIHRIFFGSGLALNAPSGTANFGAIFKF
jgi:hypothetical protein